MAWRSGYSARGLEMDLPAHLEGRVAAAELSMRADTNIALFTIYGFIGERCGPNNLAVLEWLGNEVQKHGEWIVGGDWNMEPHELAITGWPEKAKGKVLPQGTHTEAGTCFASEKAKPSYLDYCVSSRSATPMLEGSGIDMTAPAGTHRVVKASMACNPCEVQVP